MVLDSDGSDWCQPADETLGVVMISKFVHAARLGSHSPAESSRLFRGPTSQGVAFAVVTALAYYGGSAVGFWVTPLKLGMSALLSSDGGGVGVLVVVPPGAGGVGAGFGCL